MIGHNRKAGNRLYAIPRIVKGFDYIDKNPRNRIRFKIMARRIADHPRKIRKALSALDRDHIKIWPLVIKTFQSNAHGYTNLVFPVSNSCVRLILSAKRILYSTSSKGMTLLRSFTFLRFLIFYSSGLFNFIPRSIDSSHTHISFSHQRVRHPLSF